MTATAVSIQACRVMPHSRNSKAVTIASAMQIHDFLQVHLLARIITYNSRHINLPTS